MDECLALQEVARHEAEEGGCAEEFDGYFDCVALLPCGDTDEDPCKQEREEYDSCGLVDPALCLPAKDEMAAVIETCGEDSGPLRAAKCTELSLKRLECAAPCYQTASCEAFTGLNAAEGQKLDDCIEACLGGG